MATGRFAGAPSLDHRTWAVAAVRLRRRPDGGRPQNRAVGGVVGVEPIPGGDRVAGPHRALYDSSAELTASLGDDMQLVLKSLAQRLH